MAQMSRKTQLLLDLASRLAKYMEKYLNENVNNLAPEKLVLKNFYDNVAPFVGDPSFVNSLIEEFLLPHFDQESKVLNIEDLNNLAPPHIQLSIKMAPDVETKMKQYFSALCDVYTTK